MAGLEGLQRSLQHDSDEDEDILYPPQQPRRGSDDSPLDIRQTTKTKHSWSRYRTSLLHCLPWRLSPSGDDSTAAKVDHTGCLSFITYSWIFPYLWSSFRGFIPKDSQWSCSLYDSSSVNMARMEHLWRIEQTRPSGKNGPSLFRVVRTFCSTRIAIACFVFMFCLGFGFIGPTCLVRSLIAYTEQEYASLALGLVLVHILLLVELFRVLSYGACWAISYRTGLRVRNGLLGLLFKKLMSVRGLGEKTVGEVINIYANDGQRLFDAVVFAPLVLMGGFVLIGGMIYLLVLIGPWSLLGIGVFFVFDAFQYYLGKTMVKYRKLAIAQTEKRVSIITEILHCIKLIKLYGWERPFMDRVSEARSKERSYIQTAGYAQSMAIAAGPAVPVIATIATLLSYVGTGHDIHAAEAFSMITVYFVMVFGIRMIPYGSRYCAEAYVALKNMQKLLELDQAQTSYPPPINRNLAIVMQDATFAWEAKGISDKTGEKEPLSVDTIGRNVALQGINIVIEKKQHIGICGPVGSGKSSLLYSLVGQLIQQNGNVMVSGKLALAAQDPWIMNATIRDNILFGEPLDSQKFYKVLYACNLNSEVNLFPGGEQAEIGERGVTLSGGQKARLSLARALYADHKDIYLLDNCLTQLDKQVANHCFSYAIKGLLVSKTVLLVTNQVDFLQQCHEVAFVQGGRVIDQGPHEQLMLRCPEYERFCRDTIQEQRRHSVSIDDLLGTTQSSAVPLSPAGEPPPGSVFDELSPGVPLGDSTVPAVDGHDDAMMKLVPTDSLFDIPSADNDGVLIEAEEDLGLSSVNKRVYFTYINAAGGSVLIFLVFLAFAVNVGASVFCTIWLSYWLKAGHQNKTINSNNSNESITSEMSLVKNPNLSYYMSIYGISLFFVLFTSMLKAILFVKVSLRASNTLHNSLFMTIIRAPMRFFDTTPIGRIVNRFSKDMDEVDVKLPFSAETFLQNVFLVTAYLIVIAYVFPWFLVALIPLGIIFALFVACFRAGIRSLKRAENNSRSPLFSHITASLHGLATIRAFGQTQTFVDRFKTHLDSNAGCMFMFQCAMRWLAVWLDLLVVLVTYATSLLIVLSTGHVAPAYAGMALAFAIQMSGIFQFTVRMQSELEAKMTNVERIEFYKDHVEQEPAWIAERYVPPIDWPQHGRISFRDVKLQYRDGQPFALKSVSFDITGTEKIGIVGRTGSGKSSLGVALFRLCELKGGSISVDTIDISKMGLHQLRQKMALIPQDPILFAGTVKFNLDPLNHHSDQQLWDVLEKTHTKDLVKKMPNGLNSLLVEGGTNISVGERQLLCLARALLRKTRILVLDEATSNVDNQTDALIRQCVKEQFQQCTVLTIAHRMDSILHADKILYMDGGRVIEFDQPQVLLEDAKSKFYQMMKSGSGTGTHTDVRYSAHV